MAPTTEGVTKQDGNASAGKENEAKNATTSLAMRNKPGELSEPNNDPGEKTSTEDAKTKDENFEEIWKALETYMTELEGIDPRGLNREQLEERIEGIELTWKMAGKVRVPVKVDRSGSQDFTKKLVLYKLSLQGLRYELKEELKEVEAEERLAREDEDTT